MKEWWKKSELSSTEVAAILQCTPETVWRHTTDKKLPFKRTTPGGHYRYDPKDVRQFAIDKMSFDPVTKQTVTA